ncbi:MAG: signal peptidase II [Clostridiales bacterium]|nr:signal peptidase II [Clostridiales bacterium]
MIHFLCLIIIGLLVAVDQLTKVVMKVWLEPLGTAEFLPGVVQFHYVENTGAAFGMLSNGRWMFIVVTGIACGAILAAIAMGKVKSGVVEMGLVLVGAGGIGNLADRLARGYVIDFIEPVFMNFAIFNFARLLTGGAVSLIGDLIYDMVRSRKQKEPQPEEGGKA